MTTGLWVVVVLGFLAFGLGLGFFMELLVNSGGSSRWHPILLFTFLWPLALLVFVIIGLFTALVELGDLLFEGS